MGTSFSLTNRKFLYNQDIIKIKVNRIVHDFDWSPHPLHKVTQDKMIKKNKAEGVLKRNIRGGGG